MRAALLVEQAGEYIILLCSPPCSRVSFARYVDYHQSPATTGGRRGRRHYSYCTSDARTEAVAFVLSAEAVAFVLRERRQTGRFIRHAPRHEMWERNGFKKDRGEAACEAVRLVFFCWACVLVVSLCRSPTTATRARRRTRGEICFSALAAARQRLCCARPWRGGEKIPLPRPVYLPTWRLWVP